MYAYTNVCIHSALYWRYTMTKWTVLLEMMDTDGEIIMGSVPVMAINGYEARLKGLIFIASLIKSGTVIDADISMVTSPLPTTKHPYMH